MQKRQLRRWSLYTAPLCTAAMSASCCSGYTLPYSMSSSPQGPCRITRCVCCCVTPPSSCWHGALSSHCQAAQDLCKTSNTTHTVLWNACSHEVGKHGRLFRRLLSTQNTGLLCTCTPCTTYVRNNGWQECMPPCMASGLACPWCLLLASDIGTDTSSRR